MQVDDLDDIAKLETYVEASAAILIFVSRGYFGSANCRREYSTCVTKLKSIVLVYEPLANRGDDAPRHRPAQHARQRRGLIRRQAIGVAQSPDLVPLAGRSLCQRQERSARQLRR